MLSKVMPRLVTLDLRLEPSEFSENEDNPDNISSECIENIAHHAFCMIPTLNLLCIRHMPPERLDDEITMECVDMENIPHQVFKRQPSQNLDGATESKPLKIHFHSARFEPESDILFSPSF